MRACATPTEYRSATSVRFRSSASRAASSIVSTVDAVVSFGRSADCAAATTGAHRANRQTVTVRAGRTRRMTPLFVDRPHGSAFLVNESGDYVREMETGGARGVRVKHSAADG